ncbi:hypothetical protein FACS189472_08740 [Alphaproteobacteria bacterium]|nr:hypothetical protein FACS189472_08740 [Alphaproteobacteria bacterium]
MISSLGNSLMSSFIFNANEMTVVQKEYFTVQSHVDVDTPDDSLPTPIYPEPPPFDNPTKIPSALTHDHSPLVGEELLLTDKPIAVENLPQWFVNSSAKYKKIVRVLGATVNWVNQEDYVFSDPVPPNPGYRLFSNIVTNANVVLQTNTMNERRKTKRIIGKEGFVMMVNNYNSVKEFDITNENIREIQFFLRPWHSYTDNIDTSPIDFVCELELLLIDDS